LQAREAALAARELEAGRQLSRAVVARNVATADYVASRAGGDAEDAPEDVAEAGLHLAARVTEGEATRAALAEQVETIGRLRNDRDALLKQYNRTRDALDQRQAARDGVLQSLRRAEAMRAEATAAYAGASARLESDDAVIAPLLAPFGTSEADLARDPQSVRRFLEVEKDRYLEAIAARAAIEAEIESFRTEAATMQIEEKAAAETVTGLNVALRQRREEVAALRRDRAALLDGEATSAHRTRHENLMQQAIAHHEAARDVCAKAESEMAAARARRDEAARDLAEAETAAHRVGLDEATMRAPVETRLTLAARAAECVTAIENLSARLGALRERLSQDDAARLRADALGGEIAAAEAENRLWEDINAAIGSASGDRFRRFAQSLTLDHLIALANQRLVMLTPRYRLEKSGEAETLGLQIVDRDLGDERRSTRSLSGGERFLASLALALALAGLEGRDSFVDTLFIDEGFGSLDTATLDIAIDALETLQGQGRKVGVISHVDSLQQRIAVRICVERRGGGLSVVRLRAPGWLAT
jgi:exonuclease SbcC